MEIPCYIEHKCSQKLFYIYYKSILFKNSKGKHLYDLRKSMNNWKSSKHEGFCF